MTEADAFVLIHSAHHGSWVWERRAPYLSLPIVTVDLPGRNGQARGTDVTSVARCAARVAEQIEHAGIRRAVLVGHSLAGGVAYTVAADHPETVAHLDRMGPEIPEILTTPVSSKPLPSQPIRTYVLCRNDRALSPAGQRQHARAIAAQLIELDSGHEARCDCSRPGGAPPGSVTTSAVAGVSGRWRLRWPLGRRVR
jgi:pimeloyl-ACP methyl ester carboxylesterase